MRRMHTPEKKNTYVQRDLYKYEKRPTSYMKRDLCIYMKRDLCIYMKRDLHFGVCAHLKKSTQICPKRPIYLVFGCESDGHIRE